MAGCRCLGAAAIVVAITLVRSGSLPSPDLLTYYSRLFGSQGFGLQPMPTLGLHLVVYVTFAGALVLAAVRHRAGSSDRALSGLLAFAGCFGLAAGIYYAGRSNAITMVALFPAWGFALALLTWTAFRWLADANGNWRRVLGPAGALAVSVTIGFGLAATAILEIPAPWTQVARLSDDSERTSSFDLLPEAERFVAEQTEEGDAVLMLRENGRLLRGRPRSGTSRSSGTLCTSSLPVSSMSFWKTCERQKEAQCSSATESSPQSFPECARPFALAVAAGRTRWTGGTDCVAVFTVTVRPVGLLDRVRRRLRPRRRALNALAKARARMRTPRLVTRVADAEDMLTGGDDLRNYFEVGESALAQVKAGLAAAGAPPPTRILDLPCGYGRVLRHLRAEWPDAAITAMEINPDAIEFCAKTFGARPIVSRQPLWKVDAGDAHDLLWCGSLLTHFDEPDWAPTLSYFRDRLAAGGVLVFTTHGELSIDLLEGEHVGPWEGDYGMGAKANGMAATARRTGFAFGHYGETEDPFG